MRSKTVDIYELPIYGRLSLGVEVCGLLCLHGAGNDLSYMNWTIATTCFLDEN